MVVPCPPFTLLGLDLAGPFYLRIVGGSKTTKGNKGTFKAWVVLVVCLNTKALKLYLACGYATRDFLMAWEQHTSDCGHPKLVHSDRGSQLVAAAKEIEDKPDFDWDLISTNTSNKTKWRFCPANGQFRNGAVEIYVKKFKRSLKHTYNDKNLNLQEFNTALKRIANILNSRPVYAMLGPTGGSDPDFIQRLTPNMMLLGRSDSGLPLRDYEDCGEPLARLAYVSELERAWWNQHKVQDFASLVPTQKWTEARRGMCTGDIVLIQYSSMSKSGSYRLGRVIMTEVDDDGLTRTCIVKYSLIQNLYGKEREKYKGIATKMIRCPCQRLVLIVPIEEQPAVPSISEEDLRKAQELVDKAAKFEDEVGESHINVHYQQTVNTSVKQMLKARGDFDRDFANVIQVNYNSLSTQLQVNHPFEVRDVIERPYLLYLDQI